MTDWLDPLGLRTIADRVFTSAARTLVGRQIEVATPTVMTATVARVHEASPAVNMSAALNAQIGLWRTLDLELAPVEVNNRALSRVRVVADDVRIIDARPQRMGAKSVELTVDLCAAEVAAWADSIAPGVAARVEDGRFVIGHPRYARWGDVVFEPWVRGREIGADAVGAVMRGHSVALPSRLKRSYVKELVWLPDGTELQSIEFPEEGGIRVVATIARFEVPVDARRLVSDLGARGTKLAIRIVTGKL